MREDLVQSPRTTNWLKLFSLILPLLLSPTAHGQLAHPFTAASTGPSSGIIQPQAAAVNPEAPCPPNALTDIDEIARRVAASEAERQAMLQHYESDRVYHLEYNGIGGTHIADLYVHAVYNAPGAKHFIILRQTGSKGFGDKVLRRLVESEEEASHSDNRQRMAFTPENFEMKLIGRDTLNGIPAYVLEVKPRSNNRFAYSGRVWISMKDFGIIRVDGSPAQDPSWMISHIGFDTRYLHDGSFWLPQSNQTATHLVMGGEVKITITYGPYQDVIASPAPIDLASNTEK